MKAWIVWNAAISEGVVFVDRIDALQCQSGSFSQVCSALGEYFAEGYGDDDLVLQEVDLPEPGDPQVLANIAPASGAAPAVVEEWTQEDRDRADEDWFFDMDGKP